ncbi:MAG: DUF6382 domain-containing protein [Clostridia bacterium]|nr:DUF6382 domain-containing protein [Clostridia bacterium]
MISEIKSGNSQVLVRVMGQHMECAPYMIKMLENTECNLFLPIKYATDEEQLYDTVYGMNLNAYMKKYGYTLELLKDLVYSIQALLKVSESYLINTDYIVFDTQYIYVYDNSNFKYIFDPYNKENINEKIKNLVNSIVSGNFANKALTEAMNQQSFSLKLVIDSLSDEKDEKMIGGLEEDEAVILRNIIDADDCIKVSKKDVYVGKLPLINDKRLIGKLSSFRHGCIRYSRKSVYIKDLNSKYGIYVNGERIKSNTFFSIHKGDIVAFGDDEYILL